MSFMDNVKGKGTITSNPLKPTAINPLAKKAEAPAATEPAAEEKKTLAMPKAPAVNPLSGKPNPFAKKETVSEPVAEKVEEKVEETSGPVIETVAEEVVSTSESETTVEAVDEEPTAVPTETVETTTSVSGEGQLALPEETTTATPKTDKPPRKKRGSNASTSEAANSGEDFEIKEIPSTEVSYAKAIESITSPFVDEEWEQFKESVQSDLNAIVIQDDMNPATLKSAIYKLTALRDSVWTTFQGTKSLYENLSSKEPEGLIERIKKVNLGGNNDLERKKVGVEACMRHKDKEGNLINLYEVLDETRSRYNFLKSVMDSIEYKRSVLVTMNGALKMEQSLTPNE